MKYKVGDRVRIKSIDWYNGNKDEFGCIVCGKRLFYPFMSKYCGNIFTISDVYSNFYQMYENRLNWTDEMIEGLVEEENKLNDYNMKNTCYNKEKCKDKFCMKCDEFWKNANSVQRGLAVTTITAGACLAGILAACIFMGVCLILTR